MGVDRATVGLRDGIRLHIGFEGRPLDDGNRRARKLLHAAFPEGVTAVIHRPFAEQVVIVDKMIAKIKAGHSDTIELLGLGRLLDTLVEENQAYRAAQHAERDREVEYAKVLESRARTQEMLLEVIVMIMGRYPLTTDAHVAAREALLGPVIEQNEAIGMSLRSRRGTPDDVDPDTGETIVEPPPAAPPAPATDAASAPTPTPAETPAAE